MVCCSYRNIDSSRFEGLFMTSQEIQPTYSCFLLRRGFITLSYLYANYGAWASSWLVYRGMNQCNADQCLSSLYISPLNFLCLDKDKDKHPSTHYLARFVLNSVTSLQHIKSECREYVLDRPPVHHSHMLIIHSKVHFRVSSRLRHACF